MESGSGWAGLWPENHRASELKHHLPDGSWDASAGRIVPGKEELLVKDVEKVIIEQCLQQLHLVENRRGTP